ncbi:hypothetical protein KO02_22000 [Sphingobacterium sp. ML3W]|nr:hypothetical protein KO02_22000 [Sphingobacterium sp. ML3W]
MKELLIAGTIVDKNREPISNVSVYIKDKPSVGTSTSQAGKFSIRANYGDKIVFSYVGYNAVEHLAVETNDQLRISLMDNSTTMDEVMVVGLGNVQRKISWCHIQTEQW